MSRTKKNLHVHEIGVRYCLHIWPICHIYGVYYIYYKYNIRYYG